MTEGATRFARPPVGPSRPGGPSGVRGGGGARPAVFQAATLVAGVAALLTAASLEVAARLRDDRARTEVADILATIAVAERNGGPLAAAAELEHLHASDILRPAADRRLRIALVRADGTRILGDPALPSPDLTGGAGDPDAWLRVRVDAETVLIGRRMEIAETFTAFVGRSVPDAERTAGAVRTGLALFGGACLAAALVAGAAARRRQFALAAAIADTLDRVARGETQARAPDMRVGGDLDRIAPRLNATLDRLERSSAAVRDWSRLAAHELRGHLGRLGDLARGAPRDAAALTSGIDDTMRVFDALLDLVELRTDVDRRPGRVEPDEVLAAVRELYAPTADERGVELTFSADGPAGFGEHWLLVRAVADLVDNAMRHAPPATTVEVTWRGTPDGGADIVVRDRGPGPGGAALGDLMRRPRDGDGDQGHRIGLRTVEAVAIRHGGRLSIEDAQPGLRARIVLPPPPAARPDV